MIRETRIITAVFQEKQQTIRCLKNQKKETEAIMSLDMEDLVPVEEQEDIPKEGDIEAEVVLTLACAGEYAIELEVQLTKCLRFQV